MSEEFKSVSIYVNPQGDLIMMPIGAFSNSKISPEEDPHGLRFAPRELDIFHILEHGYTDEQLEAEVLRTLEECYSQEPNEDTTRTPIERFLKVKGYVKAVRGLKLVTFRWYIKEGYSVVGHKGDKRGRFLGTKDLRMDLGHDPKPGEIAKAIRWAIERSTSAG